MMGTSEREDATSSFPGVIRNISNSRQCDDRFIMVGGLPYLGVNYQSKLWGYGGGEPGKWRSMEKSAG